MDGESEALLALHDGLRQRLGSKTKLMLDAIAVEELRQIVSDLACYGRRKP